MRRKSLLPGWPLRWILTSRSVSAGPTCTLTSQSGPSPTSPSLCTSLPLRHASHYDDTSGSTSASPRQSSRAALRVRPRQIKFWPQWCWICSLFLCQDEDDKQIHAGERSGTEIEIETSILSATQRAQIAVLHTTSPSRASPSGRSSYHTFSLPALGEGGCESVAAA